MSYVLKTAPPSRKKGRAIILDRASMGRDLIVTALVALGAAGIVSVRSSFASDHELSRVAFQHRAPGKTYPLMPGPSVAPASPAAPLMPTVEPAGRDVGAGAVFFETVRLINVSLEYRLSPAAPYNIRRGGAARETYRQIVYRSVFDNFPAFKGDPRILEPALKQLSRTYRFIDVSDVMDRLDWLRGLRIQWLQRAIDEVSVAPGPVNVTVEGELWIRSKAGVHQSFVPLDRRNLPALVVERDNLITGTPSEGDFTQLVVESLLAAVENPSEFTLRGAILRGEPLECEFRRRIIQAVFLNVAVFRGNAKVLATALDLLAKRYPEIDQKLKEEILEKLPDYCAARIRWLQNDVLPQLMKAENESTQSQQLAARATLPGQLGPAPQAPSVVRVPLPSIAWILPTPGVEGPPSEVVGNSKLVRYEIELLTRALYQR